MRPAANSTRSASRRAAAVQHAAAPGVPRGRPRPRRRSAAREAQRSSLQPRRCSLTLGVEEGQQRGPGRRRGVTSMPRAAKIVGVLAADDAAADHGQRARDAVHLQDGVAVVDDVAGRREHRRAGWGSEPVAIRTTAPSQAVARRRPARHARACAGRRTRALPWMSVDAVALEVLVDHAPTRLRTTASLRYMKSRDRDVALDAVVDAVEPALAQPGEVERRLAQRLRRDACRC